MTLPYWPVLDWVGEGDSEVETAHRCLLRPGPIPPGGWGKPSDINWKPSHWNQWRSENPAPKAGPSWTQAADGHQWRSWRQWRTRPALNLKRHGWDNGNGGFRPVVFVNGHSIQEGRTPAYWRIAQARKKTRQAGWQYQRQCEHHEEVSKAWAEWLKNKRNWSQPARTIEAWRRPN